MNIDLTRNYFELFGFAEAFDLDQDKLSERYREFQNELHPDRYVKAGDQERRISVQTTAYVNQAYSTLKNDLKRAHYLLELSEIEFDADSETSSDAAFLMQTMELHEQVDGVGSSESPLDELDQLSKKIKQHQQNLRAKFAAQYSEKDLTAAKDTALKLQFYERLTRQVQKKQEQYEEDLI